ncbi:MAG TPA: flagellar basal-body MS-ring/collar protein FliF [Thermoleophilaceae bacterium]
MGSLQNTFASLTPRGRVVLVLSTVGVLVFAVVFFKLATKPSYTTLASGVDPAQTSKLTDTLSEQGIGYELQNNGTAIAVEKSKVSDARIAIAKNGLAGNSKPGYELFDNQKLGASEFQQKVTYQRALEGEVARTIGGVDGISGAEVQLTLPEKELFADEERPATAAVLLSGGADIDQATVRGIANLTASSVEGLKPANVTITDSAGQLLWPTDDAVAGGVGSNSKQAVENRYERMTEATINAMLVQTVGPGKARVQVNADLNADQSTREQLKYAKQGTPETQKVESETLAGGSAAAGGTAGTGGNVPSYAQATGGGSGNSNYKRASKDVHNLVDKTVTRTQIAPGAIKKQSVSLVLDKSVPPSDVAELRNAVEAAAGIDQDRGDILNVSQIPFAKVEPVKASPVSGALGIRKYVGLALATLIFLILLSRQLKKRENDQLTGEPLWLREIQAPATLAQLEADTLVRNGHQNIELYQGDNPAGRERQIVESADSERLAHQVRAWMK